MYIRVLNHSIICASVEPANSLISAKIATYSLAEYENLKGNYANIFKNKTKPIYAIGFAYKFVCVLCKIFPCGLRNKIIGMLYAK